MPRWPDGLHFAAGSGGAVGGQPIRPAPVDQESYWRRTSTELFAGAQGRPIPATAFNPAGPGRITISNAIGQQATAGPTAAGERWRVSLVQVAMSGVFNSPPLVTLQQVAQANASVSVPPPPVMAQAWLSMSGVNIHLLAQTTQGGYDTLDLGGQVLTPGEAITVQWWSTTVTGFPGNGWISLRGTRSALSVV